MILLTSTLQRSSHLRRAGTLGVTLFALASLAVARSAHGQFNGPATGQYGIETNRPTQVTTDQAVLFPPSREQVLTPGDAVDITLQGESDYSVKGRIGTDGTLNLPLIGVVRLAGLSVTHAEDLIAKDLVQDGMYRNPQVLLTFTEGPNSAVTFIGEMHGVIPVTGPRRLLDVLSAGGGLPASASHVITINRPGVPEPIVVDLGTDPLHSAFANIPVFAGDTVVVARIGAVYMLGQFKTPGLVNITPYAPLTLMQATALSGGLIFDAKPSDVRIIRTEGDRRTVVKLDMDAVFKGHAPDPILQPNDIVYVPQSAVKVAIEQGGLGTLLGIISVAITGIAIARQ